MKWLKKSVFLVIFGSALVGCGSSDSLYNPLPPQYPYYPPNQQNYPPNYYPLTTSCPPRVVYAPGSSYTQWNWIGGGAYLETGVAVCAGAKVTVRGSSKDNIFVSNGFETQFFTRAEISTGKTVQFSNPGFVSWGCESDCSKLDITFYEFSVKYN